MASEGYSFIDIAVLDIVRKRFAAGDALIMLSTSLGEVVWANGPGAALLGRDNVEAAIGSSPDLSVLAKRQIASARGFPHMAAESPVSVRLNHGAASRTIVFLASSAVLPDGKNAILLAVPPQNSGSDGTEAAERAISGFTGEDYVVAMLDKAGIALATSRDVSTLAIEQETLLRMIGDADKKADRLVKRLLPAQGGDTAAAVARLTDDPPSYLLVAVALAAERADVEEPSATVASDTGGQSSRAPKGQERPDGLPFAANGNRSIASDESTLSRTRALAAADRVEPGPDETGTPRSESSDGGESKAEAAPYAGPIKFVWRIEADGRFSAISDEFLRATGASAADIVGRTFAEIATRFGFDAEGEISALLDHRDTWSGRSVLWPIAETGLRVPVDLAGLPIYGRDRTFQGFRGFGVAQMSEAKAAPQDSYSSPIDPSEAGGAPPPAASLPEDPNRTDEPKEAPAAVDPDPFEGETPALAVSSGPTRRFSDKVIKLAEHRPSLSEGLLSAAERNAFREIGARLRNESAAGEATSQPAAEPQETGRLDDRPAVPPSSGQAEPIPSLPDGVTVEEGSAETIPSSAEAETRQDVSCAPPAEPQATDRPARESASAETEPFAPDQRTQEPTSNGAADVEETRLAEPAIVGNANVPAPDSPSQKDAEDIRALARSVSHDSALIPSAFFHSSEVKPGLYATLFGRLPLPVLIHSGDTLHYANAHFLQLTGHSSLEDIRVAGGLEALFADPHEADDESDRKLCLSKKDGASVPVEAFLQSVPWGSGKALLMAFQPAAANAPAAPVREEPSTEILQSRLAELRTIIDTATDGVVLIANDGAIRSISRPAEALFGFDSADVAGKPFHSLFAIESQRAARDYLNSLSDNGVASVLNDGLEVIGREAEGRFIPLFMTIGRLPEDSGFCAVVRDITQWKRAEEELTQSRALAERASSQKTDFLARISHEIRTPLNAIIGFSELMMDEKFGSIGNERYRDYLRDINRSGNHVLDLVNDLLDISKIEAGEQEMNYEAVSLNDTLAETVAMMQPQANRERVIIRSSFPSHLPEVVADLRSIRQVALNLLSNAVRYTQAGGQVIVSTSYEPNGEVVMRVRDTGVGMSKAEIEQALKPFKQINALKRTRGDGTGLGLPLTKAMVEANRARFSISSTPDVGTLVEVFFPSTRVLAD